MNIPQVYTYTSWTMLPFVLYFNSTENKTRILEKQP